MEFDVVVPPKPLLQDRYVHRKKNIRNMLFEDLDSYLSGKK